MDKKGEHGLQDPMRGGLSLVKPRTRSEFNPKISFKKLGHKTDPLNDHPTIQEAWDSDLYKSFREFEPSNFFFLYLKTLSVKMTLGVYFFSLCFVLCSFDFLRFFQIKVALH